MTAGAVTIRDAGPGDAEAIAAIWNPVIRDSAATFWPHPRSSAEIVALIAERQAAGGAFLVGGQGGVVEGFASFFQFRGGPGYARSMEHTVYVAPQAQGRGLAARLLAALEARAAAAGARMLIGAVTGSNTGSLAFHARCGYREVGRIPDAGWKFGRYHDLVLMQKLLGPDSGAGSG